MWPFAYSFSLFVNKIWQDQKTIQLFICLYIFFFDKFCTLWIFCAEIYFMYVELGSMWTLVDSC